MSLRNNPFSALADDDSPVSHPSPSPVLPILTIEPVPFVDDSRFKEWSRHPSPSVFNSRKQSEVFPPSFVKNPQAQKNMMDFPSLGKQVYKTDYVPTGQSFAKTVANMAEKELRAQEIVRQRICDEELQLQNNKRNEIRIPSPYFRRNLEEILLGEGNECDEGFADEYSSQEPTEDPSFISHVSEEDGTTE